LLSKKNWIWNRQNEKFKRKEKKLRLLRESYKRQRNKLKKKLDNVSLKPSLKRNETRL